MKKVTNIINRCLLALMTMDGIAMFFFMNSIFHVSFMPEVLSASTLLLAAFLYFMMGVVYPENRDEATGTHAKILTFLETVGLMYYGSRSNGKDEKYVGPRECRRYWDPTVATIILVLYGMFGVFVIGVKESSSVFVGLWIAGCVLMILMMIVSVFWKLEDIRERTGEWHPWIAVKSIVITIGIFAFCGVIGGVQTWYQSSKSPYRVNMDKIKEEVEQAENAEWDYSVEESDYMQMPQVLSQIKENYGDEKVYYKISYGGQIEDSNGVSCEKVSFIVTGETQDDVVVFEYYKYDPQGYIWYGSWKSNSVKKETVLEKYDGSL